MPDDAGLAAVPKRPSGLARFAWLSLTSIHTFFYRRGIGRSFGGSMQPVLLTTTGRKSGKPHTVPLGALPLGDGWVVIASFGGSDVDPNWWLNLLANPQAGLQVGDRQMKVRMRNLTDPEEYRQAWDQVVSRSPNYAGYQKKTSRKIPLGLLEPAT